MKKIAALTLVLAIIFPPRNIFLPFVQKGGTMPSSLLTDLLAWYDMDSNQDLLGLHNLTITQPSSIVAGKINNARYFTYEHTIDMRTGIETEAWGSAYNNSLAWPGAHTTISGWMRLDDDTTGLTHTLGRFGPFSWGYTDNKLFADVRVGMTSYRHTGTIRPGWNYFLLEYVKGAQATFSAEFNDEIPQSPDEVPFPTYPSVTKFQIGGDELLHVGFYHDTIAIWDRQLTAGEKNAMWNGGAGQHIPPLDDIYPDPISSGVGTVLGPQVQLGTPMLLHTKKRSYTLHVRNW